MYENSNSVYTATFRSTGFSAGVPHDLVTLVAPATSRVRVREIELSAVSSDATSIGVQLLRGSTQAASTATITPSNLKGWALAPSAASSVRGPSTDLSSTASAVPLYNGCMTDNAFHYCPEEVCMPVLEIGQRLHVRVDDAVASMQGTVVFEEIGKVP